MANPGSPWDPFGGNPFSKSSDVDFDGLGDGGDESQGMGWLGPPQFTPAANYNNIDGVHRLGTSFTNPNGSNINCAAVAFARAEGYGNADNLQEETLGYRPGEVLFEGDTPNTGLDLDDMDLFANELGRNYTMETYRPKNGRTAYQVMRETYQPPEGPSHLTQSVLAYTPQDNGGGHAVNMYQGRGDSSPTILDFQQVSFGAPMDVPVRNAAEITVFTPGEYESAQQAREAEARRMELHRQGQISFHEWASAPSDPDRPLPSFEAFQHNVGLQGSRRR